MGIDSVAIVVAARRSASLHCLFAVAGFAWGPSASAADFSVEATTVFSGASRGLELGIEYEPSDQLTIGAGVERRWRVPNSSERASGYEIEIEWLPLSPVPSISIGAALSYAYGTEREAASPKTQQHESVVQAVLRWQMIPTVQIKAKAGPGFERTDAGWSEANKYGLKLSVDLTRTVEFEWEVADADYASPEHKIALGWNLPDDFKISIGHAFRQDDPLWRITIERSW